MSGQHAMEDESNPPMPEDLAPGEERLLRAWQEYATEAYPNPERKGCPDRSVLSILAIDVDAFGTRDDADEILLHLGSCSPCASDLRLLRRQNRGTSGFLMP